ncbi:sigma factor-like helix-turn-helix DNA-binding protein [Flavivirga jejuensis]|uniref:Sigma factor-like helix-turn-helix DNA-binding protein n=1 Tax=Flavivirga jejuensis TaxID=870487 RepID=A0ABT8WTA9_9FLAO|nr:sigma factor-like helix-turn-helix DNA-binding protein [Flavivirga jejuensis]MDO5976401.1 sigma factor-like helix-turn-helix DNA-binding protein [Flavivirga jejuensis]
MENYQNILFPYAYNILGSVEDAKDAIQDVLTKHLSIEKSHIENDIGYLIKSVINQSINIKKRNNKITGNKIWLPEPISTEKTDGNIDKEEIISYSILVLLEKLTAQERAVFILKEAFDYPHKDIANTMSLTIENSRKLLSRAKTKLTNYREKGYKDYAANKSAFIGNYIQTIKNGDVKGLEQILSDDISLSADGGENIKVVREFTVGKSASLKLLFYVFKTYLELLSIKITQINHQPALLFYNEDTLINCQVFELEDNKIKHIFSIIDPLKLKSLF